TSGTTASCSANLMVNGSCGGANGVASATSPISTSLCTTGTASAVSGGTDSSTPWSWTCAGSNGGTAASCSAPYSVGTTCDMGPITTLPGTGLYIITGGGVSDCLRAYQRFMPGYVATPCPASGTFTSSSGLCYTGFTVSDTRGMGNSGPDAFYCTVQV